MADIDPKFHHCVEAGEHLLTERHTADECTVRPKVEHRIEDDVHVYLEFENGKWRVAPSTVDGHSLDSYGDGATCDYSHKSDEEFAGCEALLDQANQLDYPSAFELIPMIADHLSNRDLVAALEELVDLLAKRFS